MLYVAQPSWTPHQAVLTPQFATALTALQACQQYCTSAGISTSVEAQLCQVALTLLEQLHRPLSTA